MSWEDRKTEARDRREARPYRAPVWSLVTVQRCRAGAALTRKRWSVSSCPLPMAEEPPVDTELKRSFPEVGSAGKTKAGFPLLLHLEELKCKEIIWSIRFIFSARINSVSDVSPAQQTPPCAQSSLLFFCTHTTHQRFNHASVIAGSWLTPAGHKVRHRSKRLAKKLRVSDEEGENAE